MAASEDFWNKRADGYDAKTVKGPNYAARIERIKTWLKDTDRVLDVGCASGEITLDIAPHVGDIHGIDTCAKLIEIAARKVQERGIDNARFSRGNASDPSLAEGSFDGITAYSVLHLVDDAGETLDRLHALLKPGGALITETPCLGDWHVGWKILIRLAMLIGQAPPVVSLKVAELESMLTSAGFEVVETRVYNPKSRLHCILARKR